MKEFKDINKQYTEQLVKVKVNNSAPCFGQIFTRGCYQMSDMANSDLDKYAKALDKYANPAVAELHGLKSCLPVQS